MATEHTDPVRSSFEYVKNFFVSVLSIKRGTDKKATIEGIQRDIVFRGPTAWILMFSILILVNVYQMQFEVLAPDDKDNGVVVVYLKLVAIFVLWNLREFPWLFHFEALEGCGWQRL